MCRYDLRRSNVFFSTFLFVVKWSIPDINMKTSTIIFFVLVTVLIGLVGIVGNVLSAIVWLRRQVAAKNSSAIYLAAIAINDLLYLLSSASLLFLTSICEAITDGWICIIGFFTHFSSYTLEPLLVLGFSVERLFAIYRPIQVSFLYLFILICLIFGWQYAAELSIFWCCRLLEMRL